MQAFHDTRLGFIGGGNMARAIVAGLVASGFPAHGISVTGRDPDKLAALSRELGVNTSTDNDAVTRASDVLVLAVKPQQMAEVVQALRPALAVRRPLVVSVAAGIRAADLARWTGEGISIVRSMPNRPALLGVGATGLYADASVPAADREHAEKVLAVTGATVWVRTEAELDWVTAVSGSGPAYFFLLAELLARAGAAHGLDPGVATRLAAQTLHGAGRMAALPDADLARLRAEVTSKGGTTAAALASFEASGLAGIVDAAVTAAARRSEELGELFGKDS